MVPFAVASFPPNAGVIADSGMAITPDLLKEKGKPNALEYCSDPETNGREVYKRQPTRHASWFDVAQRKQGRQRTNLTNQLHTP